MMQNQRIIRPGAASRSNRRAVGYALLTASVRSL
jgi:hypothetical protein